MKLVREVLAMDTVTSRRAVKPELGVDYACCWRVVGQPLEAQITGPC